MEFCPEFVSLAFDLLWVKYGVGKKSSPRMPIIIGFVAVLIMCLYLLCHVAGPSSSLVCANTHSPEPSTHHSYMTSLRWSVGELAIPKMSRKLGPNHYRNGSWDCLEGQPINQAKMLRQYNCCVPGCTNSLPCSAAVVLLGIFACPVPPNDPKCLCVADSDPRFPLIFVMAN